MSWGFAPGPKHELINIDSTIFGTGDNRVGERCFPTKTQRALKILAAKNTKVTRNTKVDFDAGACPSSEISSALSALFAPLR